MAPSLSNNLDSETAIIPASIKTLQPIAHFSTIKVGGQAQYYASCHSLADIRTALDWAKQNSLRVTILGGGSNTLFPDGVLSGLLLHIKTNSIEWLSSNTAKVSAGYIWDDFVQLSCERNLFGIECLSGIPGSVGATPIQNVGAYGQEVCQTITEVETLDKESMQIKVFKNEECDFKYRHSRFKSLSNQYVVLSVTFRLNPQPNQSAYEYRDLKKLVENGTINLNSIRLSDEIRRQVIALRKSKGMVLDSADIDSQSLGSFFTNPIVTEKTFQELVSANVLPSDLPVFTIGNGLLKIPAAWLIENAGIKKGFLLGEAGISSKHSLAIINRGHAKSEEIKALANLIQSKVNERFKISLEPEPIFLT